MTISISIILDVIKQYHTENHMDPSCEKAFSECLPLPEDRAELVSESLYIGCLSKALFLPKGISCICVRDRISDDKETEESLGGLVIVNENMTVNELLLKVANRVFTIIHWVQTMNDVLLNNGTLQDLVDLCPPIIDNYISINDASLMLLAYSKKVSCDDPICLELVKTGYHSNDYIRQFRKHNYLKTWQAVNDIVVDPSCAIAKYTTVYKVFRFHNMYFAQIVMTCNHTSVTPCLLELFRYFVSVVDKYIKRTCEGKSSAIHIYDSLMEDLIEKRISKRKAIEERSQYVGLPLTGPFRLFLVVPNDSANLSIGKMPQEFSEFFSCMKFITYNNCIVAINLFSAGYIDEQMRIICLNMEEYIVRHDALCSISLSFDHLEDIPYAYRQAQITLKYKSIPCARTLFMDVQPNLYRNIHFFEDKFIYCMLDDIDDHGELWYHSDYCRKMKKLYEYDNKHHSNFVELLNIYLSQGQNASEVATIIGTHRNNIVYRIGRIKEILGLDLSEASVRYMLHTSIVLAQLYGLGD